MVGLAAYKLLVTTNHIGDREQLMLEAEGLLREALARDVDNHSVRYNLGVLYNLKNDPSAALREFERAIEFNPSHVFSHASRISTTGFPLRSEIMRTSTSAWSYSSF